MTEEMQKTKGCLQRARTESEEYAGVQTVIGISHESLVEVNLSSEMLLETIMSRGNMNAAYKRVMSNKGSGGVDNMGLDELLPYLKSHGEELTASILNGRYKPNPVRRVEIPKDNGKRRQLGIPTMVDRVIQQSLSQVLSSIYEPKFSASSYGFRPNRSAHDALLRTNELFQIKVNTICITLVDKFICTKQRIMCGAVRTEAVTARAELRFID